MKGWRGSPARHALAAKGISVRNAQRPAATAPMPMARPPVTVGEIYDRITDKAFLEAPNSYEADAFLRDRQWLKRQIHQESSALQLSIAETAELENELLPLFGEERSVVAGLVQVVDQLRPREAGQ